METYERVANLANQTSCRIARANVSTSHVEPKDTEGVKGISMITVDNEHIRMRGHIQL